MAAERVNLRTGSLKGSKPAGGLHAAGRVAKPHNGSNRLNELRVWSLAKVEQSKPNARRAVCSVVLDLCAAGQPRSSSQRDTVRVWRLGLLVLSTACFPSSSSSSTDSRSPVPRFKLSHQQLTSALLSTTASSPPVYHSSPSRATMAAKRGAKRAASGGAAKKVRFHADSYSAPPRLHVPPCACRDATIRCWCFRRCFACSRSQTHCAALCVSTVPSAGCVLARLRPPTARSTEQEAEGGGEAGGEAGGWGGQGGKGE